MAEMNAQIKLVERVFIRFDIRAATGLHIGGSDAGVEIGGVDKTVIRDLLTNQPYIPGSSLKGKMRSLIEKARGAKQNQPIGHGRIHSCGAEYKKPVDLRTKGRQEYLECDICQVFGVPGERPFATPTRLVVRDTFLGDGSAEKLNALQTDFPYTEVKTEVSIDRVTSAANPRQMERVPAGAVFANAEMIYSIYQGGDCDKNKDIERLKVIAEALRLLEDDYLGGLGSRGSGKMRIENIRISKRVHPLDDETPLGETYHSLNEFVAALPALQGQL